MKCKSAFMLAVAFLTFACRSPAVECHCWIVGEVVDGISTAAYSASDVTNMIFGTDRIFRQAAMSVSIGSLSTTNDEALAKIDARDLDSYRKLCSLTNNTGGLEIYFVNKVVGGTAFWTKWGIVVGPQATVTSLAHEIGHACGFEDIYENHFESPLYVEGFPSQERMPNDWGIAFFLDSNYSLA